MSDLTFVCWRWKPEPWYRSKFPPAVVTRLRDMVRTHYHQPHRFVCVTDSPKEIDPSIETIKLWDDCAKVQSPFGRSYPSCYRRLKAFAPEAREWFGERFVSLDLDTVIVDDITPLFDRPEDFIIWGQSDFPKTSWYNGSMWYLRSGTRPHVWTEFDPVKSPTRAKRAGARGSDQGWLAFILGKHEATWNERDGVYSYRVHIKPRGDLPMDARIVMFHGRIDPWSPEAQALPWVKRHWGTLQ